MEGGDLAQALASLVGLGDPGGSFRGSCSAGPSSGPAGCSQVGTPSLTRAGMAGQAGRAGDVTIR